MGAPLRLLGCGRGRSLPRQGSPSGLATSRCCCGHVSTGSVCRCGNGEMVGATVGVATGVVLVTVLGLGISFLLAPRFPQDDRAGLHQQRVVALCRTSISAMLSRHRGYAG